MYPLSTSGDSRRRYLPKTIFNSGCAAIPANQSTYGTETQMQTQDAKHQKRLTLVENFLRIISCGESIVELRGLDCTEKYRPKPYTKVGFYDQDHLREAAVAAVELSSRGVRGVYFTINPPRPDLLARRANRIDAIGPQEQIASTDSDILSRRWMLIDADPIRLSGVSSSIPEKESARKIIDQIELELSYKGWPDPIKADSSNGYHLLYRIDVPTNDNGLIRNCLRSLSHEYSTPTVSIDTSVYNPARICKLYGTVSRKGDHTSDRPHRCARVVTLPPDVQHIVTPLEKLQELAAAAPPEKGHPSTTGQSSGRNGASARRVKHTDPIKAASSYVSKIPPAVSGQHGHDQTFKVASILVDGFALSVSDALPIFQSWNATCQPPWSDADLERKLIEAEKRGEKSGKLLKEFQSHQDIQILIPQTFDDLISLTSSLSSSSSPSSPSPTGQSSGGEGDVAEKKTGTVTAPDVSHPSPPPSDHKRSPPIINGYETESGIIPIPMRLICQSITESANGWPKRLGSTLFIHDQSSTTITRREVDFLEKPSNLYGWLGSLLPTPPTFYTKPGLHSKEEVFGELCRTVEHFHSIESLPHEPPILGHYYTYPTPPPGNGDALAGFIDCFSPETPIDRDLIISMFATVLWGGPGGSRPAFLITSDRGRGSGKSTLASMLAEFAGGGLEISANEDAGKMKARLLSTEGLQKRVAILDNVKTLKFSWAELESLITSSTISGHRLYKGEGTRPNNLTWVITLNGVALSTDMAQRVVVIKINRPQHSGSWEDETRSYLRKHRDAIIADLIAVLQEDPIQLSRFSRWGRWERDVLSRLPDPNEAQKVITERQTEGNVESDESDLIENYIYEQLEDLTYDADRDKVVIPSDVLTKWYSEATGERHSAVSVGRIISQKINERSVSRLSKFRVTNLKAIAWTGENWSGETTHNDLKVRIEEKWINNRRKF